MLVRVEKTTSEEVEVAVDFPYLLRSEYDCDQYGGVNMEDFYRLDSSGELTHITWANTAQHSGSTPQIEWSFETKHVDPAAWIGETMGRLSAGFYHPLTQLAFQEALESLLQSATAVLGAPKIYSRDRLGDRIDRIPAILGRLASGRGPDPSLDRAITAAVLGDRAEASKGAMRVTASLDNALIFAQQHHPTKAHFLEIISDAVARMGYAGWHNEHPLVLQLARYVTISLLNDILGDVDLGARDDAPETPTETTRPLESPAGSRGPARPLDTAGDTVAEVDPDRYRAPLQES